MAHEHEYRKLNEAAVFCRSCGDIKTVEPPLCTLPHYPLYPGWGVYPYPTYVPWWTPTYPTWIVSSGTVTTGNVDIGNTTLLSDGSNITYTPEGIS